MSKFTYISFADPDRFLGGLVLEGHLGPKTAMKEARWRQCHPGGEAVIVWSPPDIEADVVAWHLANMNRLLTFEELKTCPMGAHRSGDLSLEEQRRLENRAVVVPEEASS